VKGEEEIERDRRSKRRERGSHVEEKEEKGTTMNYEESSLLGCGTV
jgi:hypothetical protein